MKNILIINKNKYTIEKILKSIIKNFNIDVRTLVLTNNPIKVNFKKDIKEPTLEITYKIGDDYQHELIVTSLQTLFSSLMTTKIYRVFDEEQAFVDMILKALDNYKFAPYTKDDDLETNMLDKLTQEIKTNKNVVTDIFARAVVDGIVNENPYNKNPLKFVSSYVENRLDNTIDKIKQCVASYTEIKENETTNSIVAKSKENIERLLLDFISIQNIIPALNSLKPNIVFNFPITAIQEDFKNTYLQMVSSEEFTVTIDNNFFDENDIPYVSDLLLYICDIEDLDELKNSIQTNLNKGKIEISSTVVNDICLAGALQHPVKTNIFVLENTKDIDKNNFFEVYRNFFNDCKSLDSVILKSIKADTAHNDFLSNNEIVTIDLDKLHENMTEVTDKIKELNVISLLEDEDEEIAIASDDKHQTDIDYFNKLSDDLTQMSNSYFIVLRNFDTEDENKSLIEIPTSRVDLHTKVMNVVIKKRNQMSYKLRLNKNYLKDNFEIKAQLLEEITSELLIDFINNLRTSLKGYSFYERQAIDIVISLIKGRQNSIINRLIYQNSYSTVYNGIVNLSDIENNEDKNFFLNSITETLTGVCRLVTDDIKSILSVIDYNLVAEKQDFTFVCDLITDSLERIKALA